MKKVLTMIAALAICMSPVTVQGMTAFAAEKQDDIVILYTNDVHCGVSDNIGYDGLALYKREMEAEHEHVLLADAGDAIQGGTMGTLTKGEYIVELMNAVGYDVAVPGNHEFDYSIPTLIERGQQLNCGYICSNFKRIGEEETVFEPYKIFDLGDKKIAFVGADTPETFQSTTPAYYQNEQGEYIYTFGENGTEIYDSIQANVDTVRAEGADYVILLGHLGEEDVLPGWSAQEVIAATNGIDAMIDAHSHSVTPALTVQNKDGKDVTVTQTGTKLANVGKMTIAKDGTITTELIDTVPAPAEGSGIAADSWSTDEERGVNVDNAVNAKIRELEADLSEVLDQKVGETAFPLVSSNPETKERLARKQETNLGDLMADAYRDQYQTDIAVMNGGGIRANIPAGDITYRELLSVMPYSNTLCAAKVTGQQILDFLEHAASKYPEEGGIFPSVSGMTYAIDKSIPSTVVLNEHSEFAGVSGEYRVKDVYIGTEPLDVNKTYTVATISYLLKEGGDGYIFSGKCDIYNDSAKTDIQVVEAYIRDTLGGTIPERYQNPSGEGRIREYVPEAEQTSTSVTTAAAANQTTAAAKTTTTAAKSASSSASATTAVSTTASPKTGDTGAVLVVTAAALAALTAGLSLRRRNK